MCSLPNISRLAFCPIPLLFPSQPPPPHFPSLPIQRSPSMEVEGKIKAPKDAHVPVPRTCKYVVTCPREIKLVDGVKVVNQLI